METCYLLDRREKIAGVQFLPYGRGRKGMNCCTSLNFWVLVGFRKCRYHFKWRWICRYLHVETACHSSKEQRRTNYSLTTDWYDSYCIILIEWQWTLTEEDGEQPQFVTTKNNDNRANMIANTGKQTSITSRYTFELFLCSYSSASLLY